MWGWLKFKLKNLTKPKEQSCLIELDINDPHFTQKYTTSLSITEVSNKINGNKRDINNQISFLFMLYLTIFLGILLPTKNINLTIFTGIVILITAIFKAMPFHKRRFELADKKNKIIKAAKKMGVLKHQIK